MGLEVFANGLGETEPGRLALSGQVIGAPSAGLARQPAFDQSAGTLGNGARPGRCPELVGNYAQLWFFLQQALHG
ncbi:hypothetical protein D3C78_1610150 [compost metagenome]